MIIIIRSKATEEVIDKISGDFGGDYIKIVVDIERKILAGGGQRHVDAEQILLSNGSRQENLWGGGVDPKTKQIDYNSMINLRPKQNPAREILDHGIRIKFDKIVKDLLI